MKSWRTTLFGVIAAAAGGVAANVPELAHIAGTISVIATALLGLFAKDHLEEED